jgi:hypothetical protein
VALGSGAKVEELVSLHKVYEIYIVGLLEKQLYIEAIPFIYKIIEIESPIKHVGIIYVILFVYKIVEEFNEESRKCIFKLVALLFYEPLVILRTIHHSIKTKLTGLEQTKYLKDILIRESASRINYNHENPVLSRMFCESYKNPNVKQVIEYYRSNLKSKKDEFERRNEYDLIFTILCHSPYLLIKFIDLEREHLHLKLLVSFLLAVGYRDAFHPMRTFELLKRVFAVLVISSKEGKEINYLIGAIQSKNIEEEFVLPKLSKLSDLEKTFVGVTALFTKHTSSLKKKFCSENSEKYRKKRVDRLKAILETPNIVLSDHIEFEEAEEDKNQSKEDLYESVIKVKPTSIVFDPLHERKLILKRTLPFRQFITGKDFLIEEKPHPQGEAIPMALLPTSSKNTNYLQIRNSMIEHLYSHKVVNKSEYNDDLLARKEDEDFLDSFLPNKDDSVEMEKKESKQSHKGSNVSPRGSRLHETDKQKEVEQLVRVLDEELMGEHNIQIGNYSTVEPEVQPEERIYDRLRERLLQTFNENRIPKFEILAL